MCERCVSDRCGVCVLRTSRALLAERKRPISSDAVMMRCAASCSSIEDFSIDGSVRPDVRITSNKWREKTRVTREYMTRTVKAIGPHKGQELCRAGRQ